MSTVTQEMIDKCADEIKIILNGDLDIAEWCVDEYKNFMVISREDYRSTLNLIEDGDYDKCLKDVAKYFSGKIDGFAATRLFYFSSLKCFQEMRENK